MGSLTRVLEDFFVERGLALPTDHAERLAAGRRQRRVGALPEPFRPAVEAFAASLLRARERAAGAGTRPRTDHAIETALAIVRDLVVFLVAHRGEHDWSTVDVGDLEAFLTGPANSRKRRLVVLRQFFRFARACRLIPVDPAAQLAAHEPRGFRRHAHHRPLRVSTPRPVNRPEQPSVGLSDDANRVHTEARRIHR